jgi:hypothetical protein
MDISSDKGWERQASQGPLLDKFEVWDIIISIMVGRSLKGLIWWNPDAYNPLRTSNCAELWRNVGPPMAAIVEEDNDNKAAVKSFSCENVSTTKCQF